MAVPDGLGVGARVEISNHMGTVRFCGEAQFKPGVWVGIEMDEDGIGKNDGSIRGVSYFTCEKPGKYGVFARPKMCTVVEAAPTGDTQPPPQQQASEPAPPPPTTTQPQPQPQLTTTTPTPPAAATSPPPPANQPSSSNGSGSGAAANAPQKAPASNVGAGASTQQATKSTRVIPETTVEPNSAPVKKFVKQKVAVDGSQISFKPFAKKAPITGFPPILLRVPTLTSIDLAGNLCTDLPDDLHVLASLGRLRLSRNLLAHVPAGLVSLPAVNTLQLDGNELEGVVDDVIGSVVTLQVLDLSQNRITGLPATMSGLTALTDLRVAANQLTSLDDQLGTLPLRKLDARFNYLSTLPAGLTSLTDLSLRGNLFTTLPSCVSSSLSLTNLDASENNLTALPQGLAALPALATLHVFCNNISSVAGDALPAALTEIDISSNPCADAAAVLATRGGLVVINDGKAREPHPSGPPPEGLEVRLEAGSADVATVEEQKKLVAARKTEAALLAQQKQELETESNLLNTQMATTPAAGKGVNDTTPKGVNGTGGGWVHPTGRELTVEDMMAAADSFLSELRVMKSQLDPILENLHTAAAARVSLDEFTVSETQKDGSRALDIDLDAVDDGDKGKEPGEEDSGDGVDDDPADELDRMMEGSSKNKKNKKNDDDVVADDKPEPNSEDELDEEEDGDMDLTPEQVRIRERIRRRMIRKEKKAERRAFDRTRLAHIEHRRAERMIVKQSLTNGLTANLIPWVADNHLTFQDADEAVPVDPTHHGRKPEDGPEWPEDWDPFSTLPPDTIRMVGTGVQGDRLKVKSTRHIRVERFWDWQWYRREHANDMWHKISFANRCVYVPGLLDVGGDIQAVGTPKTQEHEELSFIQENIQPALPDYLDIDMEGDPVHNTRFTINGTYYGGVEGNSLIRWFKTYDGESYTELENPDGNTYQATSDDVSAMIRVEYTPVRWDGAVGETVWAESESLDIARPVVRQIKAALYDGKVSFDIKVTNTGAEPDACTLKIKGQKIQVQSVKGKNTNHKKLLSKDVKVFLHPVQKQMMKLQLDPETELVVGCDDSGHRDLVALTVSFFAKRYRDK